MSTGSYRQLQLAGADLAAFEPAPLQLMPLRRVELSLVPATQPAREQGTAPAWDPHEVWLNRVKKPRDARSA